MGKSFLHDAYLSELTSLRVQLKAGLSGPPRELENEEGPSVSELAEWIKALKATHSIEATPQRARQKHSSAEEPVTARIRRRTETISTSEPANQPDAAASGAGAALRPESIKDSSNKSLLTFQERIAMEQQRNDQAPSLP